MIRSNDHEIWKNNIRSRLSSNTISVGEKVMDNTYKTWIYVQPPTAGAALFIAEEDSINENCRKNDGNDQSRDLRLFNYWDALGLALKAGEQLMLLETGMIAFDAHQKGILKNFTTAPYALFDDEGMVNASTRTLVQMNMNTLSFKDGSQKSMDRDFCNFRVRLVLEI